MVKTASMSPWDSNCLIPSTIGYTTTLLCQRYFVGLTVTASSWPMAMYWLVPSIWHRLDLPKRRKDPLIKKHNNIQMYGIFLITGWWLTASYGKVRDSYGERQQWGDYSDWWGTQMQGPSECQVLSCSSGILLCPIVLTFQIIRLIHVFKNRYVYCPETQTT